MFCQNSDPKWSIKTEVIKVNFKLLRRELMYLQRKANERICLIFKAIRHNDWRIYRSTLKRLGRRIGGLIRSPCKWRKINRANCPVAYEEVKTWSKDTSLSEIGVFILSYCSHPPSTISNTFWGVSGPRWFIFPELIRQTFGRKLGKTP